MHREMIAVYFKGSQNAELLHAKAGGVLIPVAARYKA
jgi:hypothetical protein